MSSRYDSDYDSDYDSEYDSDSWSDYVARQQKKRSLGIAMATIGVAGVVLGIAATFFLSGVTTFWTRMISDALIVVACIIFIYFDVRYITPDFRAISVLKGRPLKAKILKARVEQIAEIAFSGVVVAWFSYGFYMLVQDIPNLDNPSKMNVANISVSNHYSRFSALTPKNFYAIDVNTGEGVRFEMLRNVREDYYEAYGTGKSVSGSITYLPNSRLILSSDFHGTDFIDAAPNPYESTTNKLLTVTPNLQPWLDYLNSQTGTRSQ